MKTYSEAFKRKMLQRLIGKDAVSAQQLSRETGLSQANLSRWRREAHSLPLVSVDRPKRKTWSVTDKARIVVEAAPLDGAQLTALLERENVSLAELSRWRVALDEGETASTAMTKRVRSLERELARKEKALAEAATLLVLKKKVEDLYLEDEDDATDKNSET
jgi:transposase-like protein